MCSLPHFCDSLNIIPQGQFVVNGFLAEFLIFFKIFFRAKNGVFQAFLAHFGTFLSDA
jgi:hypothetical protein